MVPLILQSKIYIPGGYFSTITNIVKTKLQNKSILTV